MAADFSMPFGISGLRLLTPAGGLSGDAASLASARIAAVKGGLGESQLRGLQPKATVVPVNSLGEGVEAMAAGRADGVIGDTLLLAALAPDRSPALKLVPQEPYERYAVTCLLPENDSEFRHLVDLAIAQLLQRYIDGDSAERAAVDRWLGPGSAVNLPHSVLQDVFRTLMLSRESIRPVPANPAAPASSR